MWYERRNEIVETVRKSIREGLTAEQKRQLKHDHRILQKREKDLTPQQRLIVESWTGFLPILKELLRLKEAFYAIYDGRSKQEAYQQYIAWEASIPRTLYEAFLPFLLTIEEWGEETFAFFEMPVPLTNAYTERSNLSIREATRIAFGLGGSFAPGQAAVLSIEYNCSAVGITACSTTRGSWKVKADRMRFSTARRIAWMLDF